MQSECTTANSIWLVRLAAAEELLITQHTQMYTNGVVVQMETVQLFPKDQSFN
ncbi:hypothetical protein [Alicyclobacillus dauci]|uniref:YlzJ-like protein n=1 Tax=Alicyclobacillus dauci TaxID=1475485 RepID=A0ABY6YZU1_9BACL|nr:hypothetical protein [Alicyclobacillus dauci]WAH35833.1 hypothetical protein NZD86_16385 [Alicyclobacillus dauci]